MNSGRYEKIAIDGLAITKLLRNISTKKYKWMAPGPTKLVGIIGYGISDS